MTQKRHFSHKEWWLRKIVLNELKEEIYELTESVNEKLFQWNVKIVIMNKIKNSKSKNEFRIIFNYLRIIKNLFKIYVKLNNKVYNNLFYSEHKNLMIVNLKYAYLIVLIYLKDWKIFTFNIFKIKQIQSYRM